MRRRHKRITCEINLNRNNDEEPVIIKSEIEFGKK